MYKNSPEKHLKCAHQIYTVGLMKFGKITNYEIN